VRQFFISLVRQFGVGRVNQESAGSRLRKRPDLTPEQEVLWTAVAALLMRLKRLHGSRYRNLPVTDDMVKWMRDEAATIFFELEHDTLRRHNRRGYRLVEKAMDSWEEVFSDEVDSLSVESPLV
ncbi:MAG: hypothetical protein AAB619_04500, partial [Patescibacteria group bacterium]